MCAVAIAARFVRAVKPAFEDGDLRIFWLSPATCQSPNRSLYVFSKEFTSD